MRMKSDEELELNLLFPIEPQQIHWAHQAKHIEKNPMLSIVPYVVQKFCTAFLWSKFQFLFPNSCNANL